MKRTGALALILCSAAGCTAANPDYRAPDASTPMMHQDMALPLHPDLSMLPPSPDLSMPPECTGTDRSCTVDGTASEQCANNSFQIDRTCPADSTCLGGYCQVPPNNGVEGNPCASETDCAAASNLADSCQPYVIDPQANPPAEWHCGSAVGDGASGSACTDGSNCRSGFCIADKSTCFRACTDDFDCPFRNGVKTVCLPETITVEGVAVTANSCVNP
jgi:hypothetical protein